MTNPRNAIAWHEVGSERRTFKIDNSTITYLSTAVGGSASVGLAVTFSADDTVALCADGDAVIGKLLSVNDDLYCAVQVKGMCQLAGGTGPATVTRGKRIVGALGAASAKGYIRDVAAATGSYVQATENEMQKAAHKIYNTADATAIWVDLA